MPQSHNISHTADGSPHTQHVATDGNQDVHTKITPRSFPTELIVHWANNGTWAKLAQTPVALVVLPMIAAKYFVELHPGYLLLRIPAHKELTSIIGLEQNALTRAFAAGRLAGVSFESDRKAGKHHGKWRRWWRLYFDPTDRPEDDSEVPGQGGLYADSPECASASSTVGADSPECASASSTVGADSIQRNARAIENRDRVTSARSSSRLGEMQNEGRSNSDLETERSKALSKWLLNVSDLWGRGGDRNDAQREGDRTSSYQLFDDYVWPPDWPADECRNLFARALRKVGDARKKDATAAAGDFAWTQGPMAWLTTVLKNYADKWAIQRGRAPPSSVSEKNTSDGKGHRP